MKYLTLLQTLRIEDPYRTAAHICQIIKTKNLWSPSARTIQRHLNKKDLHRSTLLGKKVAYGRFEANYQNEIWVGDALHTQIIDGKKAILFCYIDDYSRLVTGFKFTHVEDTLSGQHALRRGILSRGLPDILYLDNGSPFISRQLLRSLAVLGIKLTHSKPRRPEGRGKIERFFRTVRDQFLVELAHSQINSIEGLNQSFQAWVEQVYHKRIHSETNESPLRRYLSGEFKPKIPDLDKVREAFLFTEKRTVTKTATVSLFSNCYEVDQVLIGRTVELVFDPFDLSNIDVIYLNKNFGKAVVHKVKRHSHPMVVKHVPEPVVPSGIDYLDMLEKQHAKELKESINYSKFNGNDGTEGGVEQ
jgi:putative transposase